jgi:hypothetical protein
MRPLGRQQKTAAPWRLYEIKGRGYLHSKPGPHTATPLTDAFPLKLVWYNKFLTSRNEYSRGVIN